MITWKKNLLTVVQCLFHYLNKAIHTNCVKNSILIVSSTGEPSIITAYVQADLLENLKLKYY